VWKNSKTLWIDTLKKNPDNSMVLLKYGQTFGGKEGQWAFKKAIASSENFEWKSMTFMEIARYESSIGNYDESIVNLEKALAVKKSFSNYRDAAQIVSGFDCNNIQKQQEYINKTIEYYKKAYSRKKTSSVLFQTGILLRKTGKNSEAEELFVEIIRKFPDSKYALYAKKKLEKI
jgi:tetratricopeptide (TPR) repeat protein